MNKEVSDGKAARSRRSRSEIRAEEATAGSRRSAYKLNKEVSNGKAARSRRSRSEIRAEEATARSRRSAYKLTKHELEQLGKKTTYTYDNPDGKILESVPNPFADRRQNRHDVSGSIHIEAPEFTCLCPITGQPDFATIIIDYVPSERLVESKSLKLYLGAFRQFGEFHEACVNRIANDLIDLLDPSYLKVQGRFTPRGGIPLWPQAEYRKES